jgi:hypothetical protein
LPYAFSSQYFVRNVFFWVVVFSFIIVDVL